MLKRFYHRVDDLIGPNVTFDFKIKFLIIILICDLAMGQNRDRIYFPGPTSGRSYARPNQRSEPAISVKLAQTISEVNSVEEFLNLVEGVPFHAKTSLMGLSSRFGGAEERSNAQIAKSARCTPEMIAVPVKPNLNSDPSLLYYPPCVRVNRCGGCCISNLLSCQPVASVTKNFQLVVSRVLPNQTIIYSNNEIVPIEEHTKCKCDCKVKAKDCSPKQIYMREDCSCVCVNTDEETKCRQNKSKIWDSDTCTCACRDSDLCATGQYFNPNTCSCREVSIKGIWLSDQDSTGYRFRQTTKTEDNPVIVSLDADDPRRKHKEDPEY